MNIKATLTEPTSISRNFYGVIRLFNLPDYKVIYDGHIMHGSQFTDEQKKCIPTTYYGETSGIGQVVHFFDKGKDIRLGVIGLGAGSVAGYADYVKFYELNPLVADVAKNNFFYLKDCTKEYDVVIGDGRLSLEKEELQNFDIFVLDAFSSDSIPVHLLTVEAFETYLKHINENGVIAVHISNFYIDLEPVIVGIANNFDLNIIITRDKGNGEKGSIGSSWAVLSKNQEIIESIKNNELEDIEIKTEFNKFILWTDKYSNLIRVLRIY